MLEQKKEYVLEADVEYPKELHKNHNELPFLADVQKDVSGTHQKLKPVIKTWFNAKKST